MQGYHRVVSALLLAAAIPIWMAADTRPTSAAVEIQLQLADLLFAESRFDEALTAYDKAKGAEDTAQRARALTGVIKCALRTAEFHRAFAEAKVLRGLAPQNVDALTLYADSLWAAGLFEEAEDAYRDALALNADSARGHHGLARALAARNQIKMALDEGLTALRLEPRDGEFHHTVGSIYEQMHQFEEAAIAFSNYVNLLPNKDRSDKAAWSRAEIRFLRSFGRRKPFEIVGDNPEMLHTVPFRLVRDKVIVRGSVNNGGERDFVLDTGAEQTVLSARTAQRASVVPIIYTLSAGVGDIGLRGLQVGRIDSLRIGSLQVNNVPCLIKNPTLGGLPTREADSFSPLALGMSMTIDYGRHLLTIGRTIQEEPFDAELPLRLHRLAMVRGLVRDTPVNFVVDTGGEVISISATTAQTLDTGATRRIPLKVYGTSGWDRDAFLLPGMDLVFASIRYSNFPVVVLNLRAPSALLGFQLGGIVGHRFLSKYRVGIDLERSVVRLRGV